MAEKIIWGFAMSPELKAAIVKAAHLNFMNCASWVRQVLAKAAEESGVTIDGREPRKKTTMPARKVVSDAGVSAAA